MGINNKAKERKKSIYNLAVGETPKSYESDHFPVSITITIEK